MSRIWNTIEYQVASEEVRLWATRNGSAFFNPSNYIADFPKEVTVDIQTNNGLRQLTIPLKVGATLIRPDVQLVRGLYCVKGRNPLGKRSISFKPNDFSNHPTIEALRAQLIAKNKQLENDHFESLRKQIYDKLSKTAKAAIDDNVLEFAKRGHVKRLTAWFVSHDFQNVPSAKELEQMTSLDSFDIIIDEGKRFGHNVGTSLKIDWDKKMFTRPTWSSDD